VPTCSRTSKPVTLAFGVKASLRWSDVRHAPVVPSSHWYWQLLLFRAGWKMLLTTVVADSAPPTSEWWDQHALPRPIRGPATLSVGKASRATTSRVRCATNQRSGRSVVIKPTCLLWKRRAATARMIHPARNAGTAACCR
jgi:hypothetical protein